MKKLSIVLSLILLMAVGAVFVLPHVIPVEMIAAKVKEHVKAKTGRDIDFSHVQATVYPNIGLKMEDVTISNANWAKEDHLLAVDDLEIVLALKPLIDRKVELQKAVIKNPVINLEVDPSGRTNWEISMEGVADEGKTTDTRTHKGSDRQFDFALGNIQITGAQLSFADAKAGVYETLNNVDITLRWPNMNSAVEVDTSLVFREKPLDVKLKLVKPMEFLHGSSSPGDIAITSRGMQVKAAGMFQTKGQFVSANVEVNLESIKDVLAWADGKSQAPDIPFEKFYASGEVQASQSFVAFSKSTIVADKVEAKGDLRVNFESRKDIYARLAVNKLDLDKFIEHSQKQDTVAVDAPVQKKKTDKYGWDETPIDFNALKQMDLDLVLNTQGFSLRGIEVGPSDLTVRLKGGNFNFRSSEAKLFGGTFTSDVTLNAYSATPTMAARFEVDGVESNEVLTTFTGFDKLSGAADAKISLRSAGASQKEIINNLGGEGGVIFKDGALKGVDLMNIANLIQKRISKMRVGEGKTEFVELSSSFTISEGVMRTSDIRMKGPLVRASGLGSVYLPKKYLDFEVVPVLTASANSENDLLSVPVKIRGSFDNIKVKPEFKDVVKKIIEDPKAAEEKLKEIKVEVKEVKKEIKEAGKQLEDTLKEDIKSDPVNAIQNFLGGIGGLITGAQPEKAESDTPEEQNTQEQ